MQLEIELVTSRGVIQCVLRRVDKPFLNAVEADMWQQSNFLTSEFTTFRAGVFLTFNGYRYSIVKSSRDKPLNDFWLELENLISNTIITNE